jgi:hypothetical protein
LTGLSRCDRSPSGALLPTFLGAPTRYYVTPRGANFVASPSFAATAGGNIVMQLIDEWGSEPTVIRRLTAEAARRQ